MTTYIHTIDENGYYLESLVAPTHPVTGVLATVNPEKATYIAPPEFCQTTERVRVVEGVWVVETIPEQTKPKPEYPRFYGNSKLDIFTVTEQASVAEAAISDPVVALVFFRFINSAYLSYEDSEVDAGLSILESKGLLTNARKSEIILTMQPIKL